MFTLYIKRDGTVSHVEIARSTGHAELDKLSVDTFSRWRFDPQSLGVTEKIKIPVIYLGL
jgi:TonB family protein